MQYAGYYQHQASGLALTQYRAYDFNTGRWLSRDPMGEAGGINQYQYVGNDPVPSTDPYGLSTVISKKPFPGATRGSDGLYTRIYNDGSNNTTVLRNLTDPDIKKTERDTLISDGGALNSEHSEINYDTQFYNGGSANGTIYYLYNGKVYTNAEINYLGIGQYEVIVGDSKNTAIVITYLWKGFWYQTTPSAGTLYWLKRGYKDTKNCNPLIE
jgi:RHS repeat-associated protein